MKDKTPKPPRLVARSVPFTRSHSDDDGHTLEGYAAVFDMATRIDSWEGTFDEVIQRGAFAKTISERRPVLQFDHGQDSRTGTVPIGHIEELREDDHGLFVRARLHDNDLVEPIRQAIESGAIDGMSFRFRVNRETWDEQRDDSDDKTPMRTITEVELFELGPVVFPAYAATSVGVRSMLVNLDDDERRRLVAEIAAELRSADESDAALEGTSDSTSDAGQATSGITHEQRSALLRSLALKEAP